MPNKKWTILIALAAAWLGYATAAEATDNLNLLQRFAKDCGKYTNRILLEKKLCEKLQGNVCFAKELSGGCELDYLNMAIEIVETKTVVAFRKPCGSACALLAAVLQDQGRACVEEGAEFRFHQGWKPGPKSTRPGDEFGTFTRHTYPPKIQAWVDSQPGGEPRGLDKWISMKHSDASKIFPACKDLLIVAGE